MMSLSHFSDSVFSQGFSSCRRRSTTVILTVSEILPFSLMFPGFSQRNYLKRVKAFVIYFCRPFKWKIAIFIGENEKSTTKIVCWQTYQMHTF